MPTDHSAVHKRRYAKYYVLKFDINRIQWEALTPETQQECKREVVRVIGGYLEKKEGIDNV